VLVVVVVALVLAWWPRASGARADLMEVGRARSSHGQPIPVMTEHATLERATRAEAEPRVLLQVVGENGLPVADAGVWRDPAEDAVLRRDGEAFVGATDGDGRLSFAVSPGVRATRIAVARTGFLTATDEVVPGSTAVITLRSGGEVEFHCEDLQGNPLAGTWVAVCRYRLPEAWCDLLASDESIAPGPEPKIALVYAVSDPTGTVRIRGVPEGDLSWDAHHPEYGLVEGPGRQPPDTERVRCPGRRYTLRFAPLAVVGYRIENATELWYRGRLLSKGGVAAPFLGPSCNRVQASLSARHHVTRLSVQSFRELEPPPEWEYTVLLLDKGIVRRVIPFRSVRDFEREGPVVIDGTSLAATGEPAGSITVQIVNGDGRRLDGVTLAVPMDPMFTEFRSGTVAHLPVGSYTLMAEEPSIRQSMPPCVLDVGLEHTVHEVRLTRVLFPVRLRKVTQPPAWRRAGGIVSLRFANGATRAQSLGADDIADVHLGAGRVVAQLQWGRADSGPVEFDVGTVPSDQRLEVELVLHMR